MISVGVGMYVLRNKSRLCWGYVGDSEHSSVKYSER